MNEWNPQESPFGSIVLRLPMSTMCTSLVTFSLLGLVGMHIDALLPTTCRSDAWRMEPLELIHISTTISRPSDFIAHSIHATAINWCHYNNLDKIHKSSYIKKQAAVVAQYQRELHGKLKPITILTYFGFYIDALRTCRMHLVKRWTPQTLNCHIHYTHDSFVAAVSRVSSVIFDSPCVSHRQSRQVPPIRNQINASLRDLVCHHLHTSNTINTDI